MLGEDYEDAQYATNRAEAQNALWHLPGGRLGSPLFGLDIDPPSPRSPASSLSYIHTVVRNIIPNFVMIPPATQLHCSSFLAHF